MFVVIPAYNESEKIGRVLRGLFSQGIKSIVVVDDGSKDDTAQMARESGAIVLQHKINRGQGAALQTGNEYALKNNADFVVHFDADGQFDPSDIAPAVEFLQKNNLDAVLGSRFLDARSQIPFFKKYFILPISRFINNLITGANLTDVHNGFRVLNNNALKKIKISQSGMAHNTEIVKQLVKNNLNFAEFPVKVTYHEYGQGIGGAFKIIKDLFLDFFSN